MILKSVVVALAATSVLFPAQAEAKRQKITTCDHAYNARVKVIKKHGRQAPGRNICRFGVKLSNGKTAKASYSQKVRYLNALRRLAKPAPAYLAASAGRPAQKPAGTLSRRLRPVGLAACIVHHESGGDPLATNGQYHGIAQWSPEAWKRHGGHKYAQDPHGATYDQQLEILSNGLTKYGCRDWCPFDPC